MKFHFYEIETDKKYLYRILNNISNISLENIKYKKHNIVFVVDASYIQLLKNIFEEKNIPLFKCEEKGIYTIITNRLFLKVSGVFCLVFIIFILISSRYVWNISVDGNYSYTKDAIKRFVYSKNIKEGTKISKINCDDLEKSIRRKYNDISWVCAEIKGTNLLIHIKENYITDIPKKEKRPYNLVANKNAKIISCYVRKGTLKVKKGMIVKKGDVLISGLVDVFDESEQKIFTNIQKADGDVYGYTDYCYKDSMQINYQKKIYKKKYCYYIPKIKGYDWKIKKEQNVNVQTKDINIKGFGNYYFPFAIGKYTVEKYDLKKDKRSQKTAKTIFLRKLNVKLAIMEQKGYKIIKKDVKIQKENNSYVFYAKIRCIEKLGRISYIDDKTLSDIKFENQTSVNETDSN